MTRPLFWAGGAAAIVLSVAWYAQTRTSEQLNVFEPPVRQIEPVPLCPWRDPESDLHAFFPEGTQYKVETHVLSGRRVELTKALGRMPEPDENVLTLYRISSGTNMLGVVMTKRVKGEYGAIEIVLALNPSDKVLGLHLQRLREPPAIAGALQNPEWLARFRGRTHGPGWESDAAMGLPQEARPSAQAVSEGVHSLLTMHAIAEGWQPDLADHERHRSASPN